MGKFKYTHFFVCLAAACVFSFMPTEANAAPQKDSVSLMDLDIQSKIICTATEDVASPFYKKGMSAIDACLMIRKEPNVDSEPVGKLYENAGFEVLEDQGEWLKIQSGSCEGYVYAEYVVTGKKAQELAENIETASSYARVIGESIDIKAGASEEAFNIATAAQNDQLDVLAVIPETEWTKVLAKNGQEGYVKTDSIEISVEYTSALTMEEDAKIEEKVEEAIVEETTEKNVEEVKNNNNQSNAQVQKPAYSVESRNETIWATETVNVRADASTSSEKIGTLYSGSSVKRTGRCNHGWSQIEYNGRTGYVYSDYISLEEPAKPTTSTSVSTSGQAVVDYARQFLGNPYVYGGTSLTNGADCSGFVQSIFKHFGYSLPRTCTTQSAAGRAVSVDELQPGDIIIFAADGYEISHVAIYSGNGMTIHASNWDTGIIETSISYSGPVYCCRRIVNE